MKIKFLKFFIVGAFLGFAACAFFFSGDGKIQAQSKEAARRKAEILEKVADYKAWKQVNKNGDETTMTTDVISVADSTAMG